MHVCVYRFSNPFAVHVSRDVSNNELRAALIDCMQDMFKDSAFSQVDVTFKMSKQEFLQLVCQFGCNVSSGTFSVSCVWFNVVGVVYSSQVSEPIFHLMKQQNTGFPHLESL